MISKNQSSARTRIPFPSGRWWLQKTQPQPAVSSRQEVLNRCQRTPFVSQRADHLLSLPSGRRGRRGPPPPQAGVTQSAVQRPEVYDPGLRGAVRPAAASLPGPCFFLCKYAANHCISSHILLVLRGGGVPKPLSWKGELRSSGGTHRFRTFPLSVYDGVMGHELWEAAATLVGGVRESKTLFAAQAVADSAFSQGLGMLPSPMSRRLTHGKTCPGCRAGRCRARGGPLHSAGHRSGHCPRGGSDLVSAILPGVLLPKRFRKGAKLKLFSNVSECVYSRVFVCLFVMIS